MNTTYITGVTAAASWVEIVQLVVSETQGLEPPATACVT